MNKEKVLVTEEDKVEKERLSKLTFDEKIVELRKMGYQIGKGEAVGIEDATSATLTTTGANLNVINEGYKYNIDLDALIKNEWEAKAEEVGEILGVEFDMEGLVLTPEDELVKLAVAAAHKAGGTFTPGKTSSK